MLLRPQVVDLRDGGSVQGLSQQEHCSAGAAQLQQQEQLEWTHSAEQEVGHLRASQIHPCAGLGAVTASSKQGKLSQHPSRQAAATYGELSKVVSCRTPSKRHGETDLADLPAAFGMKQYPCSSTVACCELHASCRTST